MRLAFAFAFALLAIGCGDGDPRTDLASPDLASVDAGSGDLSHACTYPATAEVLGQIGAPATELSGLVASRRTMARFWGHNDSGDTARIFSFDATGKVRSTVNVTDATGKARAAIDWEDIAWCTVGGKPGLCVADAGDNAARDSNGASGRTEIFVHRFAEPDPDATDGTVVSERFVLSYPDRPYDCEAMFVDPIDQSIYFVTKQQTLSAPVFRAKPPFVVDQAAVLEKVGDLDYMVVTAADISSDGKRIAVRGYLDSRVYERAEGQSIASALAGPFITVASDAFAEAIAFSSDGYDLYTAPEGTLPSLYYEACR